ncbi:hypothetical protein GCM10023156_09840 [Novipirellula rosea]|uniref:Uncharacterized protein n=1 Tax=Novipirellula rosea TaxID=1031540 RepID=A0ABP8MD94_9BACT
MILAGTHVQMEMKLSPVVADRWQIGWSMTHCGVKEFEVSSFWEIGVLGQLKVSGDGFDG